MAQEIKITAVTRPYGFGSLSPQTEANMRAALPACWSEKFDKCLEDEYRYTEGCLQYEPLHLAYEEDKRTAPNPDDVSGGGTPEAYQAITGEVGNCDYSKEETLKYSALAAGAGLVVGMLLAAAIIR